MSSTDADEQRERRETFAQDLDLRRRQEREQQAQGSTFLAHTHVDDAGGRFAVVHETTIVGSSLVTKYPQLSSGPWAGPDIVPPEPPLGYRINDVEPTGSSPCGEATGPASADAPSAAAPSADAPRADAGPFSPPAKEDGNDAA
jgi:hypothetical protein